MTNTSMNVNQLYGYISTTVYFQAHVYFSQMGKITTKSNLATLNCAWTDLKSSSRDVLSPVSGLVFVLQVSRYSQTGGGPIQVGVLHGGDGDCGK